MIELRSAAFADGEAIPRKYSREGDDLSPPLHWSGVPARGVTLALICDDPDAPTPQPFVHWVLYDLPATTTALAEGDDGAGTAGENDFGSAGWGGPMPPRGHGTHHYHFRIYALDADVGLPAGASREVLDRAMRGHVIDQGELIGTYERR